MPSSSSLRATASLSSTEKETDSPSVPSRSAVSKWKICISVGLSIRGTALRYAGFLALLEEGHHLAKLLADRFQLRGGAGLAQGEEVLASCLVLFDPGARKFAGLDFGEDLLHLGAGLLVD